MVSLYTPNDGLLQGWAVISYNTSIHVVPVDDLVEHKETACSCRPVYTEGVYVNNSFDGREFVEPPTTTIQ